MVNISNNFYNSATNAYSKASNITNVQVKNFEENLKQAQAQFNQNLIHNSIKLATPTTAENSSWLGGLFNNSFKYLTNVFKKAENASSKSLTDEADLVDAVTSLNEAEIALKTTQAIRDKIISAYLEIFKMPL